MNPNLVDTKMFEYDLKQLDKISIDKTSLLINIILLSIIIFFLLAIFYIFRSSDTKKIRDKNVKEKLRYIFERSNSIIQYNYN
jgi:hypothetical protein